MNENRLSGTLLLALAVTGSTICGPTYSQNQGFEQYLDGIQKEVEAESGGERGRRAIEACSRTHRISIRVRNAQDVARTYGVEKATQWLTCVVDTMYPVK